MFSYLLSLIVKALVIHFLYWSGEGWNKTDVKIQIVPILNIYASRGRQIKLEVGIKITTRGPFHYSWVPAALEQDNNIVIHVRQKYFAIVRTLGIGAVDNNKSGITNISDNLLLIIQKVLIVSKLYAYQHYTFETLSHEIWFYNLYIYIFFTNT